MKWSFKWAELGQNEIRPVPHINRGTQLYLLEYGKDLITANRGLTHSGKDKPLYTSIRTSLSSLH